MAIKLADAIVYLGTDDKGLQEGLGTAEVRMSKWGGLLTGVMAGIGATVVQGVSHAVSGAVEGIGEAITAASDMSETVAKTEQLFGDSAAAILTWAEGSASAFGQSKQQAMDAAGTYAIFGRAAGLAGDDLVNFTTDLSGLASDLASFNNTSPQQAIDAIGAALRGESEPLRAYGVLLNDATLKAAAFGMGLTESADSALTMQQRVLAAQRVIFEQTEAQQGNFARESQGLAAQTATFEAQMDNMRAMFGGVFLPIMESVRRVINTLVETVFPPLKKVIEEQITPVVQGLASTFETFAAEHAQDLAAWVADAVTRFGEFLTSLGLLDTGTGDYTLSILGRFASMWDGIRAVFDDLNALFESGTEQQGKYSEGWQGFFEVMEQLIDEFGAVIEAATLVKEAVQAVIDRDWGAFDDIGQRFRDIGWRLGLPWVDGSNVSPDVLNNPVTRRTNGLAPLPDGEPQVTYNTYLPITINAPGGDPNAVAQATQQGVQQALAARGMLP